MRLPENLGMMCFSDNLPKFHSQFFLADQVLPIQTFPNLCFRKEQSEQSEPTWDPSSSLCARHARVYRMKNHWCVEALDGNTWLNGERLQPGWGGNVMLISHGS